MKETKYDKIGIGYNSTRQADPYLTSRIFSLLRPQTHKLYLDIGCGTGNYTCALADKGLNFIGVEPSEKMLNEAKSKKQNVQWMKGNAEQIPVEDKTFDGIIATLTIHHWTDIKLAFTELNRVLKDNGRIVIFTSTSEQMKGYWLNHYFPKMLYSSIIQMPSLDTLKNASNEAKLRIFDIEKYFIKDDLKDFFLYFGKNKPKYYFEEQIRHGISSFSALANNEEVKQGLTKLRNDIDNNEFEKIKMKYDNDLGDYIFISFDKEENT
jgi:ubiquinone/menaquinone biosynthesis C-methylase UbiE